MQKKTLSWIIWILAALFYFYEFLLRVSPSVMIAELMESFHITASSIGILSAFYLYAYAPMQLPVGILLDRYGIKKILSLSSIACGTGALLFAAASHLGVAFAGRSLIGFGSSFAFISMVYLSSHWFPPKKRAFLIGSANSIAMLGASSGTGPLTAVIHAIGWREAIAILGVFGILLGCLIFFLLRSDKHTEEVERETAHIKSHFLTYLKQVLLQKNAWLNAIAALFFYMTTTAFGGLWGSNFLQTVHNVSKETAGFALSMIFMGWFIGGPLMGFFSDYLTIRLTLVRIGIFCTLLFLLPVLYFPSISIYFIYLFLFLVGLFSSAELLNFSLAVELSSPYAKATAIAFANFMISCGDAIVQPLIGFLLDLNWQGALQNGIRIYTAQNYKIALTTLPISLLFALIFSFSFRINAKKI